LGVDICGLSEVRWNGQGHFTTLDGHTIVCSGRLTQGMSEVAVWIHRKIHTYIHTNLYSAKNRENEPEALAQED